MFTLVLTRTLRKHDGDGDGDGDGNSNENFALLQLLCDFSNSFNMYNVVDQSTATEKVVQRSS